MFAKNLQLRLRSAAPVGGSLVPCRPAGRRSPRRSAAPAVPCVAPSRRAPRRGLPYLHNGFYSIYVNGGSGSLPPLHNLLF